MSYMPLRSMLLHCVCSAVTLFLTAGEASPVSLLVRADTCLNPQDASALGAVQEAVVEAAPGVAAEIGNTAVAVGKSRLHLWWEAIVR